MDDEQAHGSEVSMMAEVHPDLLEVALAAPAFEMSHASLPLMRAALAERSADQAADPDPATRCEELTIPGQDGHPDVRALVYRQVDHAAGAPVILSLHGGGYLIGDAETSDRASRQWARETGCIVVSIDYRLAPEHPYPAAIDDAWTALMWVAAQGEAQGWDGDRILLKGDSAGGGLAAGLALLARDRGGPKLAGQILIYPMLDDRTRADREGTLVWPCSSNQFAWACYLGDQASGEVAPYAAPARAQDLRGLPPTFIGTGSLDLFYREDLAYARRLTESGVSVATYVAPGAFHGFDSIAPDAGISRRFTCAAMAAVPFLLAG